MSLEENRSLVARFIRAVNDRDFDVFDQLLADHFTIPPDSPEGLSREGLKSVLTYYVSAFPDLNYAVQDQIAEGDTVVVRATMQGTHKGSYKNHDGTGKTFAVDEVDIFRIDAGKIAGYRIVWDEAGLAKQLGID